VTIGPDTTLNAILVLDETLDSDGDGLTDACPNLKNVTFGRSWGKTLKNLEKRFAMDCSGYLAG